MDQILAAGHKATSFQSIKKYLCYLKSVNDLCYTFCNFGFLSQTMFLSMLYSEITITHKVTQLVTRQDCQKQAPMIYQHCVPS